MEHTTHIAPESLSSDILETMNVAALEAVKARLSAATKGLNADPLSLGSLQAAFVQTLINAKSGYDTEVAKRLSAQFTLATKLPGLLALQRYRKLGWDDTLKILLAECDFVPQMGPLVLWSETEGGWWVQDYGWSDASWAAAGYPPRSVTSPAAPVQGLGQEKPQQTWMRWDSIPHLPH